MNAFPRAGFGFEFVCRHRVDPLAVYAWLDVDIALDQARRMAATALARNVEVCAAAP